MKRIFTLCLTFFMGIWMLNAQLPDGSIAPNFVTTDLDGNTWELYELLDQGKIVVIDLSATWCGPCWNYHTSGALENLYELYGPDGTDEMRVFMIEGDPTTNVACIYGPDGCNSSTYGDWTAGTPYPIINDDNIASLYELSYWPTIYHICPSRLVREIPQLATEDIYLMNDGCPMAFGENNGAIAAYKGFSGVFCNVKTFTPVVSLQNLGNSELTSASFEFYMNGVLAFTHDWTGNLPKYAIEDVTMQEVSIEANTNFEVKLVSVNGGTDEDETNNNYMTSANLSDVVLGDNYLTFELKTDNYPSETYWEVLSEDGTVFYSGGNALVVGGNDGSGAYTQKLEVYTYNIPLPMDGCYEFAIYDSYGDGICCVEGNGYYRLLDRNGNILIEGGAFGEGESIPFSISGGDVVNDNAAIVYYSGESGDFCGEFSFNPFFTIHNLGANPITTLTLEATTENGVLASFDWSGNIPTGQYGTLMLGQVTITESAVVNYHIASVNGNEDVNLYKNSVEVAFFSNVTRNNMITLLMELDTYAYEIYWQVTNSAGDVLISGGNQNVGPNGGGARVATQDDPGAYQPNAFVLEEFELTPDVDDCYTLLLVDDWGDGFVDGGGGYFTLENADGEILVAQDLSETPFVNLESILDARLDPSGVNELTSISQLNLFPNPAQGHLSVNFNLDEQMSLQVNVYDILGQKFNVEATRDYPAGMNKLNIDLSGFANGMYYLKLESENKQMTRKFTVIK